MHHSITSRVRRMNMDQLTEIVLNEVRRMHRFEGSDARSQQVLLCLENLMILQILETEQNDIEDRIYQRSAYYLFLRDALTHHHSTCCPECKILFRTTMDRQKQVDQADYVEVARANLITNEPLESIDVHGLKGYVYTLVEVELNRMKAECLRMQQELYRWPRDRVTRDRVSAATLRRQDNALARGEIHPDVGEDADDGYVSWGPLPTQRVCFNCEIAIDRFGRRQ